LGGLGGIVGNSHILTLVERHSRFTALVNVPSKDTAVVVDMGPRTGDGKTQDLHCGHVCKSLLL
jgi:hypothetical protein